METSDLMMQSWCHEPFFMGAHTWPGTAPSYLVQLCFSVTVTFSCYATLSSSMLKCILGADHTTSLTTCAHQNRLISNFEVSQGCCVLRSNTNVLSGASQWFFWWSQLFSIAIGQMCLGVRIYGVVFFSLLTQLLLLQCRLLTINSFEEKLCMWGNFKFKVKWVAFCWTPGKRPFHKRIGKRFIPFHCWSQVPQI